eukprot:evm.model.scf_1145EXC.5 EVM.evm.TU.scf_1145EXC.5   scf_1145EXC:24531-27013(-)
MDWNDNWLTEDALEAVANTVAHLEEQRSRHPEQPTLPSNQDPVHACQSGNPAVALPGAPDTRPVRPAQTSTVAMPSFGTSSTLPRPHPTGSHQGAASGWGVPHSELAEVTAEALRLKAELHQQKHENSILKEKVQDLTVQAQALAKRVTPPEVEEQLKKQLNDLTLQLQFKEEECAAARRRKQMETVEQEKIEQLQARLKQVRCLGQFALQHGWPWVFVVTLGAGSNAIQEHTSRICIS